MNRCSAVFTRAFGVVSMARSWRERTAPSLNFALKGRANGALARLGLYPVGAGKDAGWRAEPPSNSLFGSEGERLAA
jgi:hypothetical protein